ncbi:MAG: hypothetical protein ACLUPK_06555 [Veillonella sp.]
MFLSGASTGAVFRYHHGAAFHYLGPYNTPVFAALGAALSLYWYCSCVGKSNSPVKLILIGMGMTGYFLGLNDDDHLRSQARGTSTKCYVLAT